MIKQLVGLFLSSYFEEHNIEKVLSLVSEDIFWCGLTIKNHITNKIELKKFIEKKFGNHCDFKVKIIDYFEKQNGNIVTVMVTYDLIDKLEKNIVSSSRAAFSVINNLFIMVQFSDYNDRGQSVDISESSNLLNINKYGENLLLSEKKLYVWEYDIENNEIICSDYMTNDFNIPKIISNFPWSIKDLNIIDPLFYDDFIKLHEELKAGKNNSNMDILTRIKNKPVWFNISYKIITNNQGLKKIVGVIRDITESKETEIQYQQEIKYNLSLNDDNIMSSLRINLSTNIIEKIYAKDTIKGFYKQNDYDEILDTISKCVSYDKDRNEFLRVFSRANLINLNKQRNPHVSLIYRRKYQDDCIIWVETNAKIIKNPYNDDVMCFLYTKNINDMTTLQQVTERVLEYEYDFVLYLDMINDMGSVFSIHNGKYHVEQYQDIKNDLFMVYILKVEQYDKERLMNFLDYKNIEEKLKNRNNIENVIDVFDSEKNCIKKKKIVVTYIDRNNKIISIGVSDVSNVFGEEKNRQKQLNDALHALEETSNSKTEFLARMSHEIRTPMNVIMGLLQLAQTNLDDKEFLKDCFDKTLASSKYLLSLLNDVLDMSKLESGKIVLNNENIDFNKFINNVNMLASSQASTKQVNYIFNRNNKKDVIYNMDSIRLQQVLINIISNSIKFTSKNGIVKLTVNEESINNTRTMVEFIISDNGIGISEEFLPKIYSPFSQENTSSTSKYGGSGLGLAIVKNLVTLMHGTIEVNSTINIGTTTIVKIPLIISDKLKDNDISQKLFYDFEGKRILLVDDQNLNIMIAKKLLSAVNLQIETATNGLEALEMFDKSDIGYYKLILMDVRMPKMDGYDCTRAIRKLERSDSKNVPIIAMTANSYEADINNSILAGMNDHLAKPIDAFKLYETINKFIK